MQTFIFLDPRRKKGDTSGEMRISGLFCLLAAGSILRTWAADSPVKVYHAVDATLAQEITLAGLQTRLLRDGLRPLDQGYRGKFSTQGEWGNEPVEFTHASLEQKLTLEIVPKLLICSVDLFQREPGAPPEFSYARPALYLKTIPQASELEAYATLQQFEKVFGTDPYRREPADAPAAAAISRTWLAFSPLDDGTIRVVEVTLTGEQHGLVWKISNRSIREGIFAPTGKPPVVAKAPLASRMD